MPATNVELSKNELELVVNSEFILTKNSIIEKVYSLFGLLSEDYKTILKTFATGLPDEVFLSSPKIYKGENYLTLPYIMMDYPRVFIKEDVFAIRSFFWWGNYFSITLQLSGKFLQQFRSNLQLRLEDEMHKGYFICINNSRWEHHFEETNYNLLREVNTAEMLNKPFLKIAVKLPLHKWNDAESFFRKNYSDLIKLLVK